MKKILIAIGAVVVLLVLIAFAIPFLVPADSYRGQIVARVKSATGRDLKINGPLSFSLLPRLALEANDVTLSNAAGGAGDLLRLKKLSIALKLFPLLGGDIAIDHFVLVDPVIALEIAKDGTPNWNFRQASPDQAAATAPAPRPGQPAASPMGAALRALSQLRLDQVELQNGDISYVDRRGGAPAELQQVNLTLSLPGIDQPFNLQGSALWKSEKVDITIKLDRPSVLLGRDGSSALSLSVASKPIALTFTGTATGADPLKLDGDADLKLPSVRNFATWAGQKLDLQGTGFGPLAIAGKVHVGDDMIGFSNATLALDSIKAKGEIALDTKGTIPAVAGQLDVEQLDVNPYLPPEGKTGGSSGAAHPAASGWDESPIDASPLKLADADFKFSAQGIKFRKLTIGQSAVALHLHDGKLQIELSRVALYQGSGSGRITVDAGGAVPAVAVNMSLSQVQMAPLARDAADFDRIRGTGSWELAATGKGRSERDIIASLDGKGSLRLTNGAISGVNLLALMKNTTAIVTGDHAADETPISQAGGTYTIARGILRNNDLLMKASEFDMKGAGTVDLLHRQVDYRVSPQVVAGLIAVPVLVQGPWDNLTYLPDVVGILKTPGHVVESVGQGGLDAAGGVAGKVRDLFGK